LKKLKIEFVKIANSGASSSSVDEERPLSAAVPIECC